MQSMVYSNAIWAPNAGPRLRILSKRLPPGGPAPTHMVTLRAVAEVNSRRFDPSAEAWDRKWGSVLANPTAFCDLRRTHG